MTDNAEALACTCAHLADERKAEDIVVLDVRGLTVLTDYFVIATGRNRRQIDAIAEEINRQVEKLGHSRLGMEGEATSGWVLIDLGEAVVHLFLPHTRRLYDLELLWGDAPKVAWRQAEPLTPVRQAEGPSTGG
ncbi:MAG: ribosome silencing factor [Planctomycetota bacterium]